MVNVEAHTLSTRYIPPLFLGKPNIPKIILHATPEYSPSRLVHHQTPVADLDSQPPVWPLYNDNSRRLEVSVQNIVLVSVACW